MEEAGGGEERMDKRVRERKDRQINERNGRLNFAADNVTAFHFRELCSGTLP